MEIGGKSKGKKKDRGSSSTARGNEKYKEVEKSKKYVFELDWRDFISKNVLRHSQDVCWAIAVAGAVEGRYNLSTGEDVSGLELALQILIDGVTINKKEDYITSLKKAFTEIKKHIICKECPHIEYLGNVKTQQQKQEANKNTNLNRDIFVRDIKGQSPDDDAVDEGTLYVCLRSGPVVGFLRTCVELKDFVGPEMYCGPTSRAIGRYLQAVVICGADRDEEGNRFWLIKNSYGPKWGDGGFAKIVRLSGPGKSIFIAYNYADII